MSYTVDPRVGPPRRKRSNKGPQDVRCHDDEGQRTRLRTKVIRPAEPATALVAADQIASILIRYANWLLGTRREGTSFGL